MTKMPMGDRRDGWQSPKKHPKAMVVSHLLACGQMVAVRNIPALSTGETHSSAVPWLYGSQHPSSHRELCL